MLCFIMTKPKMHLLMPWLSFLKTPPNNLRFMLVDSQIQCLSGTKMANYLLEHFRLFFLTGGDMLPHGSIPKDLLNHWMRYYDGRFESSLTFVTTMFNQLQRHAAIRKAARVGTSHAKILADFGVVASTNDFRKRLLHSRENPESSEAKRLNAALLRILSLVGGCVPFSPFERSASRPKMAAMGYRYGIPQHWVTIAPPEHDNTMLHHIAQLRISKNWNNQAELARTQTNSWNSLPEEIRSSPRARLQISSRFPALAALAFEHCISVVTQHVLRCPTSDMTRISRDYTTREAGCYGKVAAFNGVVEPQVDGRLHAHMTVYGSNYTPTLLSRLSICPKMESTVADWFDAVSLNRVSDETRKWEQEWKVQHNKPLPRACETVLPDVRDGFNEFKLCVERQLLATNVHKHSSTCVKGKKGNFGCRLSRPSGIHGDRTQPLMVSLVSLEKGKRAQFFYRRIDDNLAQQLDDGYDAQNGEFLAESIDPIVWEQHRPEQDTMFVETNIGLAAFTGSHTNSSVMNGEDSGTAVEEYQLSYMTKEGAELKNTAVVMLTALDHITTFPSSAADSGSASRTAKYLATRTINAFAGSHEWPHALMVYALLGHRSYFSSDNFWYVYPHSLVNLATQLNNREINTSITYGENTNITNNSSTYLDEFHDELDGDVTMEDACGDDLMTDQLSRLCDLMNTEDHTNCSENKGSGGARAFHVNKQIVFVSQAQSYANRGDNFRDYTPVEFACIVDILPRQEPKSKQQGPCRPRRKGFDLGTEHPLFRSHQGFIRAKLYTPMLGGAPPPTLCRKNGLSEQAVTNLARYLICSFTPWDFPTTQPMFEPNRSGLAKLCQEWDRYESSLINRQRFRTIRNMIRKSARNPKRENVCSLWRNRNAAVWKNKQSLSANTEIETYQNDNAENEDPEACGVLPTGDELYWLTIAAAVGNPSIRASVVAAQDTFRSIMMCSRSQSRSDTPNDTSKYGFIPPESMKPFAAIAQDIHKMQATVEQVTGPNTEKNDVNDPLGRTSDTSVSTNLSQDQQIAMDWIISNVDMGKQTLSVLHGGAGTGKSFLIRELVEQMKTRGLKVITTCPTGAGACQLTGGQTFHSAFKTRSGSHLSRNAFAKMREQFDDSVGLVVVDEISMFSSEFLVLLDYRLRSLYGPSQMFGGISVCLVGDFLQLNVLMGTPICKAMYANTDDETLIQARILFSSFRFFFLEQQQRAESCEHQQNNLHDCQQLPQKYPRGQRWKKDDVAHFHPITDQVVHSLTTPLTSSDILQDPAWLDETTILVTSNTDKAALTASAVELFAERHNVVVCRWKRRLRDVNLPRGVEEALYDDKNYPSLFAYFVPDGPAQVLDNANGNVIWGVANGTPCRMHSLAWNDTSRAEEVNQQITQARSDNVSIIDLPYPPDYINVKLVDRSGDALIADTWPPENNLETEWITDDKGNRLHKKSIIIPIGIMKSQNDSAISLAREFLPIQKKIQYCQHAVDLAFVMTIWKAQGATLKRVLLFLEGCPHAPDWRFEHIYVGLSRVREADKLRCFPLSPLFTTEKIRSLRPSIYTTKWRMDIQPDGYWRPRS